MQELLGNDTLYSIKKTERNILGLRYYDIYM